MYRKIHEKSKIPILSKKEPEMIFKNLKNTGTKIRLRSEKDPEKVQKGSKNLKNYPNNVFVSHLFVKIKQTFH